MPVELQGWNWKTQDWRKQKHAGVNRMERQSEIRLCGENLKLLRYAAL